MSDPDYLKYKNDFDYDFKLSVGLMTTLVICDIFVLYKCLKSKVNSITILVSMLLVSNFFQCFGSGLNQNYNKTLEGNQKLVWASIFIAISYTFITLPIWIFAMRYWRLSLRMKKVAFSSTDISKIDKDI